MSEHSDGVIGAVVIVVVSHLDVKEMPTAMITHILLITVITQPLLAPLLVLPETGDGRGVVGELSQPDPRPIHVPQVAWAPLAPGVVHGLEST